jgi:hypothetical protein
MTTTRPATSGTAPTWPWVEVNGNADNGYVHGYDPVTVASATERGPSDDYPEWLKLPPARRRKGKPRSSDEARRFLESARADRDPTVRR